MHIILDGKYKTDRSVLALGMFDGVHIGHRVLIERAAALARHHGVPLVVCTFQQHPLQVIAPEKCPPQLTTFDERAALLEALGVDVLCAMPFDTETMNMPPEDYVGHLVRRFHPVSVVCGYNHTFGRKGDGKPALLEFLGSALGFETSVVPKITLEGREVSSSEIRRLLKEGNVVQARELLGRPYCLQGNISEGRLTPGSSEKQMVAPGIYRAVCICGAARLPLTVRIHDDGKIRLPAGLQGDGQLQLLRKMER